MLVCKQANQKKLQAELAKVRRSVIGRYKEIKGCKECGGKFHSFQLDLDHRDQTQKLFTFGPRWMLLQAWSKVKAEVFKCDVLCKNCHALKTYSPGGDIYFRR